MLSNYEQLAKSIGIVETTFHINGFDVSFYCH